MKIEFFHDVICSFCFPMSYRMRKIKELIPEIDVIHRSFALGWESSDFEQMFGSRSAVKKEVLNHWVHANQNDTLHRFNIDGMRNTKFDFPTSKNALLAAKAAGIIGDQETYWEVFDKLQEGLFVKNLNIENNNIIEQMIKETSVNFDEWKNAFISNDTIKAVQDDFELAKKYGLTGVPALIINETYLINGAQSESSIIKQIQNILEKESNEIKLVQLDSEEKIESGTCNLEDGKWECN